MTASIVQAKNAIVNSTSATVVMGSAPTNGNLLIAMVYTQQTSGTNGYTTQTGWNIVAPYEGLTRQYIWASGPWGEHTLYWKAAGAGESTSQTPMVTASAKSIALTIFEIQNVGGTFDETFYKVGSTNSAINGVNNGSNFVAGFPTGTINCPAATNIIAMGSVVLWDTLTAFPGVGPSNTVAAVAATTASGWPLSGTPKNASIVGYYHNLGPSTSVSLSGSTAKYGGYIWIALHADSIAGGGGISDIPITTTVVVPSVQAPSFKYTLIT